MRFVRLRVGNFRAITAADLPLGPGLNVLYGPNDLGKSTLGVALRAALLLPGTSAAAEQFVPWQDGAAVPTVTLDFVDDAGRFWRVEKHFGENRATLSFSKDGEDFTADAHERQVDEKLRKLLGWGIPGPGGRGGPKGMPESFLANALLAAQTDVDGILRSSLEADQEASGKLRLTKALAALGSDPLVRHVLTAAQREHDQHFTATGRRRGGRNAPLALAADEVKRLTDELLEKQRGLSEAATAEETSRRLHERWAELQQRADALEQQHRRALGGRARMVEKRAAQQRLAQERQSLTALDARALEIQGLERELAALQATAATRDAEAKAAAERAKSAARTHRDAEDAARRASSAEGEAERAVARATLEKELAQLSGARSTLTARLDAARAQQKRLDEVRRLGAQQQQLTAQLGPARATVQEREREAELISGIVHYGHWRAASEAAKQAGQLRADAAAARAEALKRTADALEEHKAARAFEEELAARRAELPDEKQRAAVAKLRRELEIAEAALGGGVTVFVRPRSTLLLRSTADEGAPEDAKISKEHVVEADRRVQLAIGDLVDIEVIAGAAEQRKDAEHLKKRWRTEGLPVLERAGVRTVQELDERVASLQDQVERIRERRARAQQLEREAETLRERSKLLDEKAAGAPSAAQLEEKRQLIGALPIEVLAQAYEAFGDTWERETRTQFDQSTAALAQARAALQKLETELELTRRRLVDAEEAAPEQPEPESPGGLEQQLRALDEQLRAKTEQAAKLEQARSGAVQQATEAVERAAKLVAAAEQEAAQAQDSLARARAAQHAKSAERDVLAAQLAAVDRAALLARLKDAETHLASFADVELLSDDELARRERALAEARAAADQARSDAAAAEGALRRIGGPQAREQVRQLEEALTLAKAREHHLEVDAEAWRLLLEAVREAEQEDASGLGAALAGPVSSQFAALTKGRYPAVRFTPSLQTSGLDVPGTQASPDGMLEALSVGTRDQLAMLVRLAIALQLESAIVLDDHLVHTDLGRLEWFRDALRATAAKTQVLVLTCRPLDYVDAKQLPTKDAPWRDVEPRTRVVDLARIIARR